MVAPAVAAVDAGVNEIAPDNPFPHFGSFPIHAGFELAHRTLEAVADDLFGANGFSIRTPIHNEHRKSDEQKTHAGQALRESPGLGRADLEKRERPQRYEKPARPVAACLSIARVAISSQLSKRN